MTKLDSVQPAAIRKEGKLRKQKGRRIAGKVATYAVLSLYALVIIFPFLIVILTSLKTRADAALIPFQWGFPSGATFDNYSKVIESNPSLISLMQGLGNTLMYIIPPTVIGLFASSLSAYAFSKLRFRAKKWMYTLLLSTMLVPGIVMLPAQFLIYDAIQWYDTPLPLMIPGMFGAAACVFFMRQFYTGIPDSLIEASKIDGLGFLGIFFKIMVPLSVPALLAQGLLGFVGGYNDFLGPLLYVHEGDLLTLQLVLRTMATKYASQYEVVMAACITALLPVLIVYFICQKFFINGIVTSGLKD